MSGYHAGMTTVGFPATLQALLARIQTLVREVNIDAYVVGGSVRDALLGRPIHDLDLAVTGDALAFARLLADDLGGSFVMLDDENAVARLVLDESDHRPVAYLDVAQMQGDVEADLRRRDLTIDALAVRLGTADVIDMTGGVADLESTLVRVNSASAFDDDPLRMLRAVRIASELRFTIEPSTVDAIRGGPERVLRAAGERQREEVLRIFALPDAGAAVRLLDDVGLLEALLPEVAAGRGVEQPPQFHAYDVLGHAKAAVDAMDVLCAPSRPAGERAWMWAALWEAFAWDADRLRSYIGARAPLLRIAALLHDVAKPQTKSVETDGRIRFLGHADEGATVASKVLRRMRFSTRDIEFVTTLVREHLRPVQLARIGEAPTARALYRFHRDVGEAFEGVLLLSLADGAAAAGDRLTRDGWTRQVAYMNSLIVRLQGEGGIVHAPRLLTGHDIMSEFGLAEGPRIGVLLEAVREAQAVGDVHDRESALTFVRARLA